MEPNGSLWLPDQASTLAPAIDWLFNFVNYVSLVFFLGVVGAMLFLVWRYRRRSPADRPAPVKESKLLEASWIVVPTILVLLVFTWGFQTFVRIGVSPPDAYEIRVRGYQWAWDFYYPEGFKTTNEIYVPVGRPVRMLMDSQDVLHSFFIPAFRVKHDVLPNRYTSVWFEATKEGTYDIFCTEFCGNSHAYMLGKVRVVDQNTFNEWVESGGLGELPTDPVELGRILYRKNACNTCHSIDGTPGTGPTWKGLWGSAAHPTSAGPVSVTGVDGENYLRESILQPGAKIAQGFPNVMPSNYSQLPSDQLDGLIAYIKTLQ